MQLRVKCTLFCNLQSRVRTHTVLVIGLGPQNIGMILVRKWNNLKPIEIAETIYTTFQNLHFWLALIMSCNFRNFFFQKKIAEISKITEKIITENKNTLNNILVCSRCTYISVKFWHTPNVACLQLHVMNYNPRYSTN